MSDTKIQFPFNSNYSVSTVPHHSVFLREVTHSSSTIHNWKHTSASCLQSDWWSRMIHGELTQKICLMSAMTSLISQLHLVCLLQKQAQNHQTKDLAKWSCFQIISSGSGDGHEAQGHEFSGGMLGLCSMQSGDPAHLGLCLVKEMVGELEDGAYTDSIFTTALCYANLLLERVSVENLF